MSATSPADCTLKYTVVTSGRPRIDGTHGSLTDELLLPSLDVAKRNGVQAKQQAGKGSARAGAQQPSESADSKSANTSNKAPREPLDVKALENYCPRTTTFLNGRPCPLTSSQARCINALHPETQPSAKHPAPSQVDTSVVLKEEPEDVASVESNHQPKYLRAKRKEPHTATLDPTHVSHSHNYHASRPVIPAGSPPPDGPINPTSYMESYLPDISKLSDSELLTLLEATSSPLHGGSRGAPNAHPHTRTSALHSILQDMVNSGAVYTRSRSRKFDSQPSIGSNPSSNWSLHSEDPLSHSWSDAPSTNWRSPTSNPSSDQWLSWSNTTSSRAPLSTGNKRRRPTEDFSNLDFLEHPSSRNYDGPVPKRPHTSMADDPQISHPLRQIPHPMSAANLTHAPPTRPNPFANAAKHPQVSPSLSSGAPPSRPSEAGLHTTLNPMHHPPSPYLPPHTPEESTGSPSDSYPHAALPSEFYTHASALESKLQELRSFPPAALAGGDRLA